MSGHKKKILLADPSHEFIHSILEHKNAHLYIFETVTDGVDALKALRKTSFDLVIIDQMMPHVHGIEIIKTIREEEKNKTCGWVVTSYHIMIQNWRAAVDLGIDAFLPKPQSSDSILQTIENYFQGTLEQPSAPEGRTLFESNACYTPKSTHTHQYIRFWGTRGSNAVAGSDYVRYGGNTSCLEIRYENDLIILDAGTGIRELSESIKDQHFDTIHLFISHTHWDHITGFPFFHPVYNTTTKIIIYSPIGFEKSTEELFSGMLAYAFFPVRLDDMQSKIIFQPLQDHATVTIGKIKISTHYTNHPGVTFGFKIESPNKSMAYITDNELLLGFTGHPSAIHRKHPLLEPHLSLLEFVKGVDFLVHEAQYFQHEYCHKIGWGHSSMANASIFVKYSGCKRWIVTHHDPSHTDKILQRKIQVHLDILEEMNMQDIILDIAYDGYCIPL
ncbi:hypothetical protein COB21_04215 [Candidatus Aerophobetes bacterium]|uniref:Response regulatory domain-containing protein n=1 Tax=Aerophobetes bacterium TaxID=2030807 RepID=A0A2A4X2K9_UNCAE|nr:MAG: hypothetical protein COB21_04215 [Candidatus Aerophobetes bacterium]